MTTLHHTAAPVHSAYLAVADRYVDDLPEGPSAEDSAWWAMVSEDMDADREYAAMVAARPFMLPGETGLTDFDCLSGLIG